MGLSPIFAQYDQKNLELVSNLQYPSLANDVWGYTAPDGTEYALMGLRSGVSVVSLADPASPVEIQYIPGDYSSWRDLKTWGHFAYVVADEQSSKEGVLVIDLSNLPDDVAWYRWQPVLPGESDTLFTCHNLWIDEFGYAYLSGCNTKSSNVVFLDVFSEPGTPKFSGYGIDVYSHDNYVRDNILYSAEIYAGQFSVYDVSDKSNPVLLGRQHTPFLFSHNVWLSDDGKTLFNTDEKANAPTSSFDISDFDDIRLLDEYRPAESLGKGAIPHNVHVKDDFLVISNYTDGCRIVDADRPGNLIEVGHFDPTIAFEYGYHGDWGAYPFFPSGLIAISDIELGLFILKPTYQRACYLEGQVTDATTNAPIINALVEIQSSDPNPAQSNISGNYKTGQVTPGEFQVKFKAKGYFEQLLTATLANGELTVLNTQMQPLPPHRMSGKVLDKKTGEPVAGAMVLMENGDFSHTTETDGEGNFVLPAVLQGSYQIFVGKWGYKNFTVDQQMLADADTVFQLESGYEDNFNLDLGWTVSGDATNGHWVRGIPKGTFINVEIVNAATDSPKDSGNRSYITGNEGNTPYEDEVDDGSTILTSPPLELRSRYNRPLLSFDFWFYDVWFQSPPNDTMIVSISNGTTSVVLQEMTPDIYNQQVWQSSPVFNISELLELTDDMRLIFHISDRAGSDNLMEASVDNIVFAEGFPDDRFVLQDDLVKMRIYPNPFNDHFMVDYKVEKSYKSLSMILVNPLGQLVQEVELNSERGTLELRPDLAPGLYFVAFRLDDKLGKAYEIVKAY